MISKVHVFMKLYMVLYLFDCALLFGSENVWGKGKKKNAGNELKRVFKVILSVFP